MAHFHRREVLTALYRGTHGGKWNNSEHWIEDPDISLWHGVEVDKGCVVKLLLLSNNLQGSIPGHLGHLFALKTLDLSANKLNGPIPEALGDLSTLVHLLLNNNQLTGKIPASLGQLGNLQVLNLRWNHLSGPDLEALASLDALEEHNLSQNFLREIPEALRRLSNLRVLNLGGRAPRPGGMPRTVGEAVDMAAWPIELAISTIWTIPVFAGFKQAPRSSFTHTGEIPETLGNLEHLRELDLSGNSLTGDIPRELERLLHLQELNLSANMLEGFPRALATAFLKIDGFTISTKGNQWKNPPRQIVEEGLEAIVRYHSDIELSGSHKSWMLKVVVIGAVRAGKSSVVESLIAGKPQPVPPADRTRGVTVHMEEPCQPDASQRIQFIFWDFAGHDHYYSTHSLFLSSGALFLLVVDLARFVKEPTSRSDSIHIWLDKVACRTPGAVVQIVATHIDELSIDHEEALVELREAVSGYCTAKSEERQRVLSQCGREGEMLPVLQIVEKILPVSCKEGTYLTKLGEELAKLGVDGTTENLSGYSGIRRKLFPDVGQTVPGVRLRACAVMDAWRDGTDPLEAACGGRSLKKLNEPMPCISLEDAQAKWKEVAASRALSKQVRQGEAAIVLQDAIKLKQHEGTCLLQHDLLYLDPTWIDEVLHAVLDHRLRDPDTADFWNEQLRDFSKSNRGDFYDLSNTHQTFRNTGTLTVSYLRFLWREVRKIQEVEVFKCVLLTMRTHGVLFSPTLGVDSSTARLFVPVLLGPHATEKELEAFSEPCQQHKWRWQRVYRIFQSYVPAGVIGMVAARLLCNESVNIDFAWRRGLSFTIGGGVGILVLRRSEVGQHAEIEVDVAGPCLSDEAKRNLLTVGDIVKNALEENFPGLLFDLDGGRARLVQGADSQMAEIKGVLDSIAKDMVVVQRSMRSCVVRLTKLQARRYPHLVVIRPHAPTNNAAAGGTSKPRFLSKTWMKSVLRGARSMVRENMRLVFVCPHDITEVPCGPNGEGFPLEKNRDWVKKLLPAAQVTMVILKVAVKVGSGLDVGGLSDYLNLLKDELGEELADHALDEEALRCVMAGEDVGDEHAEKAQTLSRAGYSALEDFMQKQESKKTTDGYVDFEKEMTLVDDGNHGSVWVSNGNVPAWEDNLPTRP